jgi:hypothetical protein
VKQLVDQIKQQIGEAERQEVLKPKAIADLLSELVARTA